MKLQPNTWQTCTDVSCHIHSTWPSQSTSFLLCLILVTTDGKYNLWSYALCSFFQYAITFRHKSLTDQHCCQTQSTVFPQCHRPMVTPTFMKIPQKHTHTHMFSESRRENKNFEAVVGITPKYFPLNFFILQSLFLNTTPK
jgi:hypothetical protein